MNTNILLKEQNPETNLSEKILQILFSFDRPISSSTLSVLLNEPSYKVCRRMRKLEKKKEVMLVTCKREYFWQVRR